MGRRLATEARPWTEASCIRSRAGLAYCWPPACTRGVRLMRGPIAPRWRSLSAAVALSSTLDRRRGRAVAWSILAPSRAGRIYSPPVLPPPAPTTGSPNSRSSSCRSTRPPAGHGESLPDALARIEAPTLVIHRWESLIFYAALVQQTVRSHRGPWTPVNRVEIAVARGHLDGVISLAQRGDVLAASRSHQALVCQVNPRRPAYPGGWGRALLRPIPHIVARSPRLHRAHRAGPPGAPAERSLGSNRLECLPGSVCAAGSQAPARRQAARAGQPPPRRRGRCRRARRPGAARRRAPAGASGSPSRARWRQSSLISPRASRRRCAAARVSRHRAPAACHCGGLRSS